jgi:hypothetical protein
MTTEKTVSVSASVPMEALARVAHSVTAHFEVLTYPQALLIMGRQLIDEGQFALAVIVCHMACEVATEQSLSALEEAAGKFLSGYNLANKKNRKLYMALTGDHIEQQPFWPKFKASADRRNAIVHGELRVGQVPQGDAEESFKAVSDLVGHLKQ